MGYFNTDQLENDDALTAEYADKLVCASLGLELAAAYFVAAPTPANRDRLIRAARDYSGAQGDLAFVGDTCERH